MSSALISLAVLASIAYAEDHDRAVIRFADIQGVRNWHADGTSAILLEGYNRRWYRATFFASCIELPWQRTIAFVTEPTGELDKFSSIIAGDQRCFFKTFDEVPAPQPETGN